MFENPILMTISATALLASPVASVLTSVRTYQSGEHPTAAMPIDEYEKKKNSHFGRLRSSDWVCLTQFVQWHRSFR